MNGVLSIFHEAALEYAARGWAVFPLKPRDKTPMIGPSKSGAHDGGFHLASKDATQINAWWSKWPNANIGLRCGEESGVFVLDLDGDEAEAGLATLIGVHGALPPTLEQRTGKGRHLIFSHKSGVRNRGGGYLVDGKRVACKGFDVRGEGGYVVLPPSVHPSGRIYAWSHTAAIADAPDWLHAAIIPPAPTMSEAPQTYGDRFRDGRATAYGEKALDSACRRIATASPGTQNTTLTGEAAAIGELVAGGEIERGYAERALVQAASSMTAGGRPWLPDEIGKKVSWGLLAGQSRPRKITRERSSAQSVQRAAADPARDTFDAPAVRANARLAIAPDDETAMMIVADESCAEEAAIAWEAARGGPYGLFVVRDLKTLAGGLDVNAGGYPDWRHPRPHHLQPGATMRWRGRVLIVLPGNLVGFTVSAGTKWEKFISVERHAQVLGVLAAHWWKQAGASDVQVATLPANEEEAA